MNKLECVLACGHSVRKSIGIDVGDYAYCRFDGGQEVTCIFLTEWRVLCIHCQYARWTGQDERYANRLGSTHERNRRGHITFVVKDRVTQSGGTPRKNLVIQASKQLAGMVESVATGRADEAPPF